MFVLLELSHLSVAHFEFLYELVITASNMHHSKRFQLLMKSQELATLLSFSIVVIVLTASRCLLGDKLFKAKMIIVVTVFRVTDLQVELIGIRR